MQSTLFDSMKMDATFSPCGRYRWSLRRVWDESLPLLVVVMLNPSTADATKNDPTVAKVIKFARAAGYGGIVVLNIFAWRSTDPTKLPAEKAVAVGELNNETIANVAAGKTVLCAWGKHGCRFDRGRDVADLLIRLGCSLVCLDANGDGSPKHPLYISLKTPMREYRPPEPAHF